MPADDSKPAETYNASNIRVLDKIEGIRKRPSMYIGDTGERGLHHLVYEIVDNSIDEGLAGHCNRINLTLNEDRSVTIEDNGRGIPVEMHPIYKKPTLELIMEKLHAGGKFDKGSYKVSGGLHGVGMSVVCALSEWLQVEVRRDGKKHTQKFARGIKASELASEPLKDPTQTGTTITFFPDPEIFHFDPKEPFFKFTLLANRLRELAFLNPYLEINITEKNTGRTESHHYEGGIREFVIFLDKDKNALHPPIYIQGSEGDLQVEVALQYNDGYLENVLSFANNINTIEGGTHLTGFKLALTRVINKYLAENERCKKFKIDSLSGSDIREGLTAVISAKVAEPQFEGQTKTRLGNVEIKATASNIIGAGLEKFFEENPAVAEAIIDKNASAQRARLAAKKARDAIRRKTALDSGRLPGKLADCSAHEPEKAEIFIVEGDSAGGSAKQGRSREFQAILPLRGKILNVEKAQMHKILDNKEIRSMIAAFGVGITGLEEEESFDIEKLRYHKIIIMCDADVDGAHIKTLILTFFFRYMRPLIDGGYIYSAIPPLFKVSYKKKEEYVYEENKLQETLIRFKDEFGIKDLDKANIRVQRYKGLGEMNPTELWETTMNPDTRRLVKMEYLDFSEANDIFSRLMGDDVAPRRKFIFEHYKEVTNLDI